MHKYKFKKDSWVANLMLVLMAVGGVLALSRLGEAGGVFDGAYSLRDGLMIMGASMVASIGAHEGVHIAFARWFGVHPRLRFWRDKVLGFGLGMHFPGERMTIRQLRVVLVSPQLLTLLAVVAVMAFGLSPRMLMAVWVGMTVNLMSAVGDMRSFYRVRKLPRECFVESGYKEAWLYSHKALDDKSVVEV